MSILERYAEDALGGSGALLSRHDVRVNSVLATTDVLVLVHDNTLPPSETLRQLDVMSRQRPALKIIVLVSREHRQHPAARRSQWFKSALRADATSSTAATASTTATSLIDTVYEELLQHAYFVHAQHLLVIIDTTPPRCVHIYGNGERRGAVLAESSSSRPLVWSQISRAHGIIDVMRCYATGIATTFSPTLRYEWFSQDWEHAMVGVALSTAAGSRASHWFHDMVTERWLRLDVLVRQFATDFFGVALADAAAIAASATMLSLLTSIAGERSCLPTRLSLHVPVVLARERAGAELSPAHVVARAPALVRWLRARAVVRVPTPLSEQSLDEVWIHAERAQSRQDFTEPAEFWYERLRRALQDSALLQDAMKILGFAPTHRDELLARDELLRSNIAHFYHLFEFTRRSAQLMLHVVEAEAEAEAESWLRGGVAAAYEKTTLPRFESNLLETVFDHSYAYVHDVLVTPETIADVQLLYAAMFTYYALEFPSLEPEQQQHLLEVATAPPPRQMRPTFSWWRQVVASASGVTRPEARRALERYYSWSDIEFSQPATRDARLRELLNSVLWLAQRDSLPWPVTNGLLYEASALPALAQGGGFAAAGYCNFLFATQEPVDRVAYYENGGGGGGSREAFPELNLEAVHFASAQHQYVYEALLRTERDLVAAFRHESTLRSCIETLTSYLFLESIDTLATWARGWPLEALSTVYEAAYASEQSITALRAVSEHAATTPLEAWIKLSLERRSATTEAASAMAYWLLLLSSRRDQWRVRVPTRLRLEASIEPYDVAAALVITPALEMDGGTGLFYHAEASAPAWTPYEWALSWLRRSVTLDALGLPPPPLAATPAQLTNELPHREFQHQTGVSELSIGADAFVRYYAWLSSSMRDDAMSRSDHAVVRNDDDDAIFDSSFEMATAGGSNGRLLYLQLPSGELYAERLLEHVVKRSWTWRDLPSWPALPDARLVAFRQNAAEPEAIEFADTVEWRRCGVALWRWLGGGGGGGALWPGGGGGGALWPGGGAAIQPHFGRELFAWLRRERGELALSTLQRMATAADGQLEVFSTQAPLRRSLWTTVLQVPFHPAIQLYVTLAVRALDSAVRRLLSAIADNLTAAVADSPLALLDHIISTFFSAETIYVHEVRLDEMAAPLPPVGDWSLLRDHGELNDAMLQRLVAALYKSYVNHARFYVRRPFASIVQEAHVLTTSSQQRRERLAQLVTEALRTTTHSVSLQGTLVGDERFEAHYRRRLLEGGGGGGMAARRAALRPLYYHVSAVAALDEAAMDEASYRVVSVGGDNDANLTLEEWLARDTMGLHVFQELQLSEPLFRRVVRTGNALVTIDASGVVRPIKDVVARFDAVFKVLSV